MIDENQKCHFCRTELGTTYKQMHIQCTVYEECCEFDTASEYFLCGNCRSKFYNLMLEQQKAESKTNENS